MNPSPTRHSTFDVYHILALLLAFFSIAMSAIISRTTFERLPHLEDEVTYLWQAKLLSTGQVVIDTPDNRRAFWQPFIIDFNNTRFGKYSLGWPLVLMPGVLLGQTWVINAFLAGLTVALVYRLAREIFDPDTAVIAAALTAFSPIALLLNSTLMGHTAALFTTMLFFYAYWRLSRVGSKRRAWVWGVVAGLALGFCVINRPLEGLALAVPFVAWSGMRLLRAAIFPTSQLLSIRNANVLHMLVPLIALGIVCTLIVMLIPIYNYAATGDPTQNLYTLVWNYDQVGFGEGYGRHVHTLEKGLRQTRWDLSLTAADLFGWQSESILTPTREVRPELRQHLLNEGDYWQPVGLSWLLLPFGILIAFRRRSIAIAIWLLIGALIFIYSSNLPTTQSQDAQFATLWMIAAFLWLVAPVTLFLFWKRDRDARSEWAWLLLAFSIGLIILHVAYWIGSQRYGTRYYYEILGPLAIISALPLAWLARRVGRLPVYAALTLVLVVTLFNYSLPRINVLHRFNWVSPELIQAVEARREGDRPLLVIVSGTDVRWRALGSLMAVTNPLLDSDIVAAIDNTPLGDHDAIIAQFPGRQVIQMTASANSICFGDSLEGECYGEPLAASTG
jgi:4-amino-4-deoxy-L-arabinose transferase-like glycosyltransferase